MIDIKDNTNKMAKRLREGHTMLNEACPICQSPIFRDKEENLYCPTCNREVKIIEKTQEDYQKEEIKKTKKQEISGNESIEFKDLNNILKEKINWLTKKLKNENQLELIEKYIKLIEKLYDLLNIIK